jgi:glycosyltransferase involved in cell wall biosynthesis
VNDSPERLPAGRRLRVVGLIDAIGVTGGGERFARDLTEHLDPDRFERTLCVSRWDEEARSRPDALAAVAEIEAAGVEFVGLERESAWSVGAWRPLLRLLREREVDVLHAHKFGSNVWGAILDAAARPPVFVAHEQTWSYRGRPLRRWLDRHLIARRADTFIAVSSEDRRRMIEIEGIDPAKIEVVVNAIVTPEPSPDADVRAELGIAPDALVIGTVCMLRPQKALEVLLEAVPAVREQHPGIVVLIAGDGPERDRLEAMSQQLGIEDAVRFAGMRSDVADVLRAFDVWISCSDYEGTSLAVMEAMDASLPIVATRVGGTPDLIDDGVHGLLVEPRDSPALANAVNELLDDRERASAFGRAARARRRTEFDIAATARRVGELYERLLTRGRAVGGRRSA